MSKKEVNKRPAVIHAKPSQAILAAPSQHDRHIELMKMAMASDGGLEKMEKLMVLQERWEENEARKAFNEAMSLFQSLLPAIEKLGRVFYEGKNGKANTDYSYARMEDIAQAIKPALKQSGLSYRFKQKQEHALIKVICIITHKGGHSDSSEMFSTPDTSGGKDGLKSLASTVSYLRRYTLTGLLGIVVGGEDSDGSDVEAAPGEAVSSEYPDEQFQQALASAKSQVDAGNKTPKQILDFLTKKGVILNPQQTQQINNLGGK